MPLPWLHIVSPNNQALVIALSMNLDKSESKVIALTYGRNPLVILDDLPARSVAQSIGLKINGEDH
jgi:predicted nucleic acid-binding protein